MMLFRVGFEGTRDGLVPVGVCRKRFAQRLGRVLRFAIYVVEAYN